MGEEAAAGRYEPEPAFEEVKEEAMLDMSPTDSKEFWLIQWIKDKELDVSHFDGKELSLKLHKDGNFGSLESSSGKSYDLVSFAYQQPNATIFLPSGSETKAVGKISRRVCLVRHREHEELEKPNFGSLTPSSKKSAEAQLDPKGQLQYYAQTRGIQLPSYCPMQIGTPQEPLFKSKVVIDGLTFESPEEYRTRKAADIAAAKLALTSLPQVARSQDQSAGSRKAAKKRKRAAMKALAKKKKGSRFIAARLEKYRSSQGSALSVGAMSKEQTPAHNKKIEDESNVGPSVVSGKPSEGPDARGAQSNTATEMPQTTPGRPKKKVKIA